MRDEMDSRLWLAHGHDFSETVAGFFAEIGKGLKRLNEIQFDAPWKRDGHGAGHA